MRGFQPRLFAEVRATAPAAFPLVNVTVPDECVRKIVVADLFPSTIVLKMEKLCCCCCCCSSSLALLMLFMEFFLEDTVDDVIDVIDIIEILHQQVVIFAVRLPVFSCMLFRMCHLYSDCCVMRCCWVSCASVLIGTHGGVDAIWRTTTRPLPSAVSPRWVG